MEQRSCLHMLNHHYWHYIHIAAYSAMFCTHYMTLRARCRELCVASWLKLSLHAHTHCFRLICEVEYMHGSLYRGLTPELQQPYQADHEVTRLINRLDNWQLRLTQSVAARVLTKTRNIYLLGDKSFEGFSAKGHLRSSGMLWTFETCHVVRNRFAFCPQS